MNGPQIHHQPSAPQQEEPIRLFTANADAPLFSSFLANLTELFSPTRLQPGEITARPIAVKDPSVEKGFFASLRENFRAAFNPPQIRPGEFTSTPVAVRQRELEKPWFASMVEGIQDLLNPPQIQPGEITATPVAVRESTLYAGSLSSLLQNIKDLFFPPKLAPIEVTSKPVAVRDIWGRNENRPFAGMGSLVAHAVIIGVVLFVGTRPPAEKPKPKENVTILVPDIAPYEPKVTIAKQQMGGGGGGGNRELLPASVGKLPKVAPRQFVPPTPVVNNLDPKLVMEPTIVVQPDAVLPQVALNQLGNPLGVSGPPSAGTGSGGGIGSGSGGGVGPGRGAGYGPGTGGGTGGGAYRIGGGVSQPIPIYRPEPEYSEEARKAKFQGAVLLSIVIDENGRTRDVKVIRPLGLGLDEKAIEAVLKWRFRPSQKDGKAVPVMANVEVNFRLL